jgi:hypothetical protein
VTERLGAIPRNTLPMTNVVIDLIPETRGVYSVHTSRYVNRKNHFAMNGLLLLLCTPTHVIMLEALLGG